MSPEMVLDRPIVSEPRLNECVRGDDGLTEAERTESAAGYWETFGNKLLNDAVLERYRQRANHSAT